MSISSCDPVRLLSSRFSTGSHNIINNGPAASHSGHAIWLEFVCDKQCRCGDPVSRHVVLYADTLWYYMDVRMTSTRSRIVAKDLVKLQGRCLGVHVIVPLSTRRIAPIRKGKCLCVHVETSRKVPAKKFEAKIHLFSHLT